MFAFTKVFLAALAVASSVRATITIDQPNIIGNATNTISWSSSDIEADPPVFSVELINVVFNSQFALANNIQTTQNSITFSLPVVAPGDGYSIQFVDIGNINNIFAKTGDFAIQQHDANAPLPSTTPAAPKPSSTTTSRSSTTSRSTVTQSSSTTSTSSTIPAVTITPSLTTSASSTASATTPGTSGAAASPSPSSGATGIVPAGAFAAFVAGAVALAL